MTSPLSRVCSWCQETFFPETRDHRPLYCSKAHATKGRHARRDWRRAGLGCPTPHKVVYTSIEAADEACERVRSGTHAYRCVCGHVHVGHRKRTDYAGMDGMVGQSTFDALRARVTQLETEAGHIADLADRLDAIRRIVETIEERIDEWERMPWHRRVWLTIRGKGTAWSA